MTVMGFLPDIVCPWFVDCSLLSSLCLYGDDVRTMAASTTPLHVCTDMDADVLMEALAVLTRFFSRGTAVEGLKTCWAAVDSLVTSGTAVDSL